MKLPKLKTVLVTPLVLFALFYAVAAIKLSLNDDSVPVAVSALPGPVTIAIFGASGTAGDGILKAALASPDVQRIHVITRRATPRMEEGIASGKVQVTLHEDYLDYSAVLDQITDVDAVYWAIGPTEEEAHIGQNILYWFFAPVGAAVRATQIGEAMIDVTIRGAEFENGRKLGMGSIIRYSKAYDRRRAPALGDK